MIATLPDAAWNVGKVLAEGGRMSAEIGRIDATIDRAAADADRSSALASKARDPAAASRAAVRAQKYAEIGERARVKALATQRKLAAFLSANIESRVLIAPSTMLLVKEVADDNTDDKRGRLHAWLSRYVFQVSAVHREKRA